MSQHWILQASPDRYNIDAALHLDPDQLSWSLPQESDKVKPGDVAWLWRASGKKGRTSGVIARCLVAGAVAPTPADRAPDPHAIDWSPEPGSPRVPLQLQAVLPPGVTLDRARLRATPDTATMLIMRQPNRTVFPVSQVEGAALAALFDQVHAAATAWPTDPPPPGLALDALRARRAHLFTLSGFWQELDANLARRRDALPEMLDLVQRFLDGVLTVGEFRDEFDVRTRSGTWSAFGFGGMSGGMALNKMVKHMPDATALETVLRAAVRAPADADAAVAQLDALAGALEAAIAAGSTTRGDLQPARLPFLVSALWHVQAPELWPVQFQSVRDRLLAAGLEQTGSTGQRYVQFRQGERAARAALRLPGWTLDIVCAFKEPERPSPEPSPGPSNPLPPSGPPRSWAIGVGHTRKDAYWKWFQDAGIMAMGGAIGDLRRYDDRDAMHEALAALPHTTDNPTNDSLASWRFLHEIRIGDEVIAREGRSRVVGRGVVTGEYRYDETTPYEHIRGVRWEWTGTVNLPGKPLAITTLVDLSSRTGLLERIRAATGLEGGDGGTGDDGGSDPVGVGSDAGTGGGDTTESPYTIDDALRDLFMDRSELLAHLARLRRRKNLVLQGPPGTGKTFVADRIARLLTGDASGARVRRVQFHQSYTYEHFVQGFQANTTGGFVLTDGPFVRLCDVARDDPGRPYVMLIDEINRGNLGRIMGELMMLIEADKRDERWAVDLAYSGRPFWVPPNVHLVGTMNTADRSLALVDYALRRRFAFATVSPAWGRTQLRQHLQAVLGEAPFVERIIRAMRDLNQQIASDGDLGTGFRIGHSWFCAGPAEGESLRGWWDDVVETEIEPLLREYWFDRDAALDQAREHLRWDAE